MPYIIIVIAILISLVFVTGSARVYAKDYLSKRILETQLVELSKKPVPEKLGIGAMCYEPVMLPQRVEYTCPKDGSKTFYTDDTAFVNWDIPAMRRLIKKINNPSIMLDESQFCKKESPNVTSPKMGLVVKLDGVKKPHITWGVTENDLKLIDEFLSGSNKHAYGNGAETPLKDDMKRIKELLGI
ncbi:MAG: hypothetical protein V1843_02825 [bacterium]